MLTGLVLSGLWIGETVLTAAFGGQIQRELKQTQIQSTVDDLDGHVVVCGYGTFGKTVAHSLEDAGQDVVVVETQEAQFDQALDDDHLAIKATRDGRNPSPTPASSEPATSSAPSTTRT